MAARPRTATTAPPASAEGRGTDPPELLARATDGTAIVNEKVAHANAAARKGKRPMFVNIGTASRRRKGDSVPTGAAATIRACHRSPQPLPSEPPGSLIDQLLGYARHVLAADHTVLFEVDPATNTVANRACSGVLTPAEVSQVDTPLPLSDFLDPAGVEYLLTSTVPSVLERRSPTTPPGVRGISRADRLRSRADRAGAVCVTSDGCSWRSTTAAAIARSPPRTSPRR